MANDVVANAGSGGATFNATDCTTFTVLSTGGLIPGAILYVGANASTEPTGVTDAHPLPVTVRSSAGTEITTFPVSAAALPLPSGAATAANQATQVASLASIDGKITAVNTGAVVISSALPAGTNAIGKLSANSGVDIGDVDVTSVPTDPFGANADAGSASGSISAKLRFIATTGIPITGTVTVGSHAVTNAGTFAVQSAQSGTWTVGLSAAQTLATVTTVGTVTNLSQMAGVAIAMGTGVRTSGTQRVTIATDDSVPVTIASVPSHAVTNAGTFAVQVDAKATGGATPSKTVSAASTNATSVKASAGTLYGIQVSNVNAAVRYLKLYNKASAPTVGTDVPVKTIAIPGNTAGAGNTIAFPYGVAFSTGIAFALTTEATDAGTTGVAANEIVVNLDYA